MFKRHVKDRLSAYRHSEVTADESRRISEHLRRCAGCSEELRRIDLGISLAERLPGIEAPADLWDDISSALERPRETGGSGRPGLDVTWIRIPVAAALAVTLVGGAVWYLLSGSTGWEVDALDGKPRVGEQRIDKKRLLRVGELLETDSTSRARISVGAIGHVEIDPNTRIRLLSVLASDHRLALERGRMHAVILAPPRIFFVETPSGTAVDLGCEYTLEVDQEGGSLLRVVSGWVGLILNGRESMVPTGAACRTKSGIGPGSPFFEDSPEELQQALFRLDFEGGGREEIQLILSEAQERDTLTLWHMLFRVDIEERGRIFDRMAALVAPPPEVTRDRIVRLDRQALDLWRDELEIHWF